MPYAIIKISPRRYEVINVETGKIHSKNTTLNKAKAQIRVLTAIGGALSGAEVKELSKASYEKNRPEKIGDFVLDKALSTDEAAVYYNPKTGKASVAHRGTEGATDWLNNIALATGYYKYTPRYKRGKETQKKVNEKYGKENVDTVSHSQSGQLAHKLNEEGLVHKSIEINPARLPFQKIRDNETIIRSSKDPVSALVPIGWKNGKVETIDTGKSVTDVIGQHSYDIIQGENENKMFGNGMKKGKPVRKKLKIIGGGFFDDIGRTFTGAVNTVGNVGNQAVNAVSNVGNQAINKLQDKGMWEDVGKKTARTAIDYAIPATAAALTTATGNPELAPIAAAAASNFISPEVKKKVGLGKFKKQKDFYHPVNRSLYDCSSLYKPVGKFHLEEIPRRYM